MPSKSGYYQRALMRDLMTRLKKIRAACGLDQNGAVMSESQGGAQGGDEYNTLVSSIHCQIEEIKKDCRAKYRVASNSAAAGGSAMDSVALAHDIRRKKTVLKGDVDRLAAMNKDLAMQIEKKKEKTGKKPKNPLELERNQLLLRERENVYTTLVDAYDKLEFLSNKILQQASDRDEQRMREANRPMVQGRKLKLMDGNIKPDGTFERPESGGEVQMDAATKALFDELDKKNVQINAGLDQISKTVKTLKQQALAMGEEISKQNIILDGMEERMENVNERMAGLTLKVGKFSKTVSHSNVALDLLCIIILLALIGYIVYLFKPKIIPGS